MSLRALFVTLGVVVAGCSAADDAASDDMNAEAASVPKRNWVTHPAIVEVDDADEVYALSDVHGHYEAFAELLANNGLIASAPANPKDAKWSGGKAILVITGDLIDKGPNSIEAIDLARTIQTGAARAGGRVIVTMGNHEAEFLKDPENDKATSTGQDKTGIDAELKDLGIKPKSLVAGTDPGDRGQWLAGLPFAARVKKWFFAHGGNTSRMTVDRLADKLKNSIDHNGFRDKDITGDDSILEAQKWYGHPDDDNAGTKEADALGVNHIVFGHDPGALDDHGDIHVSKNGVLVKIDTEMGMHNGSGIGRAFLLHITTRGKDTAESLDESGKARSLL
jgi:Calcineurin-like phosphoesterase